jgi:SpoIID/LytB domain protein
MRRATVLRPRSTCAPPLRWLAGLVAGFALAGLLGAPPAAAADEVLERPADGVFAVDGHGWGHGRGMSQWGAQGAASLGRTADEIVASYYPGTARSVLAPAPIRVLLQGDDGVDLQVHPAAGLTVTDVASGATAVLPQGPVMWRVTVDAAGLHVESLTGTVWTPFPLGTSTSSVGPVRFSGAAFHRVALPNGTSRDYRGVVQAVRTGPTVLASVVVLDLEDYLLGVVPRESSASWRTAALEAQSIAARSYSANTRDRVAGAGRWDICDTTQCQVFGGTRLHTRTATTELEPATTTAAVRATAGVVRTYAGKPILAEYSSSNGGWSTAGNVPYLSARPDPWDSVVPNPVHAWRATLRAADLERRFPTLGTLKRIRVTARDGNGEWGGRVRTVVLEGVSSTGAPTTVTTTGAGVYGARPWPASSDGLRSSWWKLTAAAPSVPVASLRERPMFKGSGPARVGVR